MLSDAASSELGDVALKSGTWLALGHAVLEAFRGMSAGREAG